MQPLSRCLTPRATYKRSWRIQSKEQAMHDREQQDVAIQRQLAQTQHGFLQRWLPHPILTTVLVLLWMALLGSFTIGGLLFGILLGVLIPIGTAQFWPGR